MIVSIRKFLLINLLLAITITTSLTALGNFYLDQEDIQEHLDTILSETAFTMHALLNHKLSIANSKRIQNDFDNLSSSKKFLANKEDGFWRNPSLDRKYQFQVWTSDGKLLLKSPKAPNEPLMNQKDGLSDKTINDENWRVFSIHDTNTKLIFAVAEKYDVRNRLARIITEDDIYIMLLTYPLSGILIWIIIGRGLGSLKRVASEVAHRAPTYLEPVNQEAIPVEIKPLVAELNKLFLRLQQAFEREQRFAADAAHELRTPLAAIKTQAQVALKTTNDEEKQTILNNVINGVDRSTHIVQQLLTLSRIAPEATTLEDLSAVNLVKLSRDIISQLVPVAIDNEITIELVAPETPIEIQGNITALSILLRNIIDNAIRYTPQGGHVSVIVAENGNSKILKVVDNGPGIPPELRIRVFERFYRILGNTSPGSGLGLAIVQKIASLHNAEVKLDTPANGKGLEFTIVFSTDIMPVDG